MLFLETRIEAFVPQIKRYAEAEMEKTLNGKIKLSIGNIEGGILRPLEFNNIEIKDAKKALFFSSVDIASIRTNYRIWDLLLKGRNSVVSNFISRSSRIYINFAAKNEKVTGFVQIEGNLADCKFKGYANILGKERADFVGALKQDSFDIEISPARGLLKAKGVLAENGELTVSLRIDHVRFFGYDIVCNANIKNKIVSVPGDPKASFIEGELETQSFILNYKQFLNAKCSYKISGNVLTVSSMDIGDSFKVRGDVALKKPYNVNIVLVTNNVSIGWLASSLGAPDITSFISGTLNSKVELSGPIKTAKLNAVIDVRKGTISTLDFDSLNLNLKGDLPIIRIEDSRITRQSGYFALDGEIDLRKLGKGNLFDGIKLKSDERAIMWDGWGTTRINDVEEVRMEKKLNEDISLDFKKFITNQKVDESVRDNDEVQLEYKLHPHDSLKLMVGQYEDFLGVEHKDEF